MALYNWLQFRVWDKVHGVMHTNSDSLVVGIDTTIMSPHKGSISVYIGCYNEDGTYQAWRAAIDNYYEIMQCIGVKDVDGHYIYEADYLLVVEDLYDVHGRLEWTQEQIENCLDNVGPDVHQIVAVVKRGSEGRNSSNLSCELIHDPLEIGRIKQIDCEWPFLDNHYGTLVRVVGNVYENNLEEIIKGVKDGRWKTAKQ